MNEKVLHTANMEQTANIFGNFDSNAALIEQAFGVSITNRERMRRKALQRFWNTL